MVRTGKPIRAMRALATCAIAALLSASAGAGVASADMASFASTGGEQTFTVPARVTSLQVVAVGGRGGGMFGGFGAVARATLPVTPGQTLFVNVGGNGAVGETDATGVGAAGGFNGGGSGGHGSVAFYGGGSGGGATDVRSFSRNQPSSLGTRLVVAGGGGGTGARNTSGGAAGSPGATGARTTPMPYCTGGNGGSQGTASAGGDGGARGTAGNPPTPPDGTAGTGGEIGQGGSGGGDDLGGGGGGGGGLFGGGGGASAAGDFNAQVLCQPGGGGGGSSGFVASATSTSVSPDTSGVPSVTIEWTPAPAGRDAVAPRLSALSLSRTAFVAANFGPSAVAAAKVGTIVSYRLSETARVTFEVERSKAGIRRGGRCVKRTRKVPANARKCKRWVKVKGSFTQDAATGANRIRFMGRLRSRALRTGSYRFVLTAKDAAGNTTARPARRGFRII